MDFIYEELSKFAPVYYEEIVRNKDGSVELTGTSIVYSLEGMFQLTDNKVRKDIPLSIDLWYLKKDLYEIETMVYDIDKKLSDAIFRTNDMTFTIKRSDDFVMNIPDDSLNIRRKRMSYVVKYYKY